MQAGIKPYIWTARQDGKMWRLYKDATEVCHFATFEHPLAVNNAKAILLGLRVPALKAMAGLPVVSVAEVDSAN